MNSEKIREICLQLPGVTEGIKWEHDLCFMIAEKMFCVTALDGLPGCSFKCTDEDFDRLTEREHIIPAPYMARNKWVRVEQGNSLTEAEWEHYIRMAYRLIREKLPKKVQSSLGEFKTS